MKCFFRRCCRTTRLVGALYSGRASILSVKPPILHISVGLVSPSQASSRFYVSTPLSLYHPLNLEFAGSAWFARNRLSSQVIKQLKNHARSKLQRLIKLLTSSRSYGGGIKEQKGSHRKIYRENKGIDLLQLSNQ